jgi:hypothetical protein
LYLLNHRLLPPLASILEADTLKPEAFGGFGNHFLAFIRGLFVCYILKFERIVVGDLGLGFRRPFKTTDGMEVILTAEGKPIRVVEVNSFEMDGSPECPLDDIGIAATIREELVKWFPKVEVNDSALYVCARGGDVMLPGTPYWFYGQPPCHYYTDAMRMDGRKTFVMSNREGPSPCVAHMVNAGASYVSAGDAMSDVARLVHARRIVVSRTTFTMAAMLLSKPKDVLYAFVTRYSMCIWPNHTWSHDSYDRFGRHHKCRATLDYEEAVLREWQATEEQMHIMETTSNGCKWAYG